MTLPRCRTPYKIVGGTLIEKSKRLYPVQHPAIVIEIRSYPKNYPATIKLPGVQLAATPHPSRNRTHTNNTLSHVYKPTRAIRMRLHSNHSQYPSLSTHTGQGWFIQTPEATVQDDHRTGAANREGECNICKSPIGDDRPLELEQYDAHFPLQLMNVFERLWEDLKDKRRKYWNFVIRQSLRRLREDRDNGDSR